MLALIVARSKNNVIGKDGRIPWRIKGEQKQFKELTTGNTVIMGRNTYEDIGHPLPNRFNIVISRTVNYEGDNLITVDSLEKALTIAQGNIFIAGGYNLFKEAIRLADKMYITDIDLNIENGSVYFPEFDEEDFDKEIIEVNTEDIPYKRSVYTRKLGKGVRNECNYYKR